MDWMLKFSTFANEDVRADISILISADLDIKYVILTDADLSLKHYLTIKATDINGTCIDNYQSKKIIIYCTNCAYFRRLSIVKFL